jgi:hypothetical protein
MKKTLRNDLILIISLIIVLIGSLLAVLLTRKKNNLVAKIYVKDELVQTIDLVKTNDTEFIIHGANGDLVVSIKDHSIGVIEANCPHQDCVHMGFIKETNRPIICAYNQVYIIIEGNSNYDLSI